MCCNMNKKERKIENVSLWQIYFLGPFVLHTTILKKQFIIVFPLRKMACNARHIIQEGKKEDNHPDCAINMGLRGIYTCVVILF